MRPHKSSAVILLALATLFQISCGHQRTCSRPLNGAADRRATCRTPLALEVRAKRIIHALELGYAHAPPLSIDEHRRMSRLSECIGASVLGSGDGCLEEREAVRVSGLEERYHIRDGQFTIPELLASAAAMPLGAERTQELLVALNTARDTAVDLTAYLRRRITDAEYRSLEEGTVFLAPRPDVAAFTTDPVQLGIAASDIEQAIVCDAEDLARGCREGRHP